MAFPAQTVKSDHIGTDIIVTSQNVIIKAPNVLVSPGKIIPGIITELTMNDIHKIVTTISDKFGVDISKEDFRSQFKC